MSKILVLKRLYYRRKTTEISSKQNKKISLSKLSIQRPLGLEPNLVARLANQGRRR